MKECFRKPFIGWPTNVPFSYWLILTMCVQHYEEADSTVLATLL